MAYYLPWLANASGFADGDTDYIVASRTTAHRERKNNSAAFHLTAPLPTGISLDRDAIYVWTWTDTQGLHKVYDCPSFGVRIYGDGSAAYTCKVHLWMVRASDGAILNAAGSQIATVASPTQASGTITLTVTDNAAATVITVTKPTSTTVECVNGGTTYYANESSGSNSNDGLSPGAAKLNFAGILAAYAADNQVWNITSTAHAFNNGTTAMSMSGRTNLELVCTAASPAVFTVNHGVGSDILERLQVTNTTGCRVANILLRNIGTPGTGRAITATGTVTHLQITDSNVEDSRDGVLMDPVDVSGMYVCNSSITSRFYTWYSAYRHRYCCWIDTDRTQETYSGLDGDQSQERTYSHRDLCIRGGTTRKKNGVGAIHRTLLPNGLGSGGWNTGTIPYNENCTWNNHTSIIDNGAATQGAAFQLNQEAEGSGDVPGEWRRVHITGTTNYKIGDKGGPLIGNAVTMACTYTSFLLRNSRLGEDQGDTGTGDTNSKFNTNGVTIWSDLSLVSNLFMQVADRASFSGDIGNSAVDHYGASGTIKWRDNLVIYNIEAPSWTGVIAFNADDVDDADFDEGGNAYVKCPLYGSSAQTGFIADTGGNRTRAAWLAGTGVNDLGYDLTEGQLDATFNRSTHQVTGGTLSGNISRSPFSYFTVDGKVRGSTTTAGPHDPGAATHAMGG